MSNTYKRVLVLSHNAFSKTQNNGKTLESFFQDWDKNSLAQIYLQPEMPDFDFCSRYFRMTDYEVLNNVLFKGEVGHEVIDNISDVNSEGNLSPFVHRLYTDRRRGANRKGLNKIIHNAFVARVPIFVSMREIIWSKSNWKTNSLVEWIKEFSPEVLFFQGSSCVFGYEIAKWICDEFNIPLILELTDDYTNGIYKWSILEKLNKNRYKRVFEKAVLDAYRVITISEYMSAEYKKRFGGEYIVLMNSVNRKITSDEPKGIRLLYAGNVSIKRWQVLEKIGRAIDEINKQYDLKCRLDIYTPTAMQDEIRIRLSSVDSINCKGSLTQDELAIEIQNSNILVHVEAFDKKMKIITRLSISTKIPEYMGSKRCIFAVGPSDVASIMYLRDNSYAKVVENDEIKIIKEALYDLLNKPQLKKSLIESAYEGFCLKHNPEASQKLIWDIMENACGEEKNING